MTTKTCKIVSHEKAEASCIEYRCSKTRVRVTMGLPPLHAADPSARIRRSEHHPAWSGYQPRFLCHTSTPPRTHHLQPHCMPGQFFGPLTIRPTVTWTHWACSLNDAHAHGLDAIVQHKAPVCQQMLLRSLFTEPAWATAAGRLPVLVSIV